ncbi:MAG: nuclear transport factor 2 family protein [Novosphingobium sp.]|uniref:nuclear transport factor 2 family protein n=1 Tax=Tsuneonella sp. CC-YZS046 TaxID=3042152 RepID=UPI002D7883B3|nr:nuclear transport factor 2 family protein [Tsuneonella sp. CC-YZS046]WRO67381.1 nuclear transport factor 2 family protein [Tsuneonella sp. CC-YZS046]
MADYVALVDKFLTAYNDKDFETMRNMMVPDIDMAHYNRNAFFNNREDLVAILPVFADNLAPDRKFSSALRVTASGNIVIRESDFSGTATGDIPNFASKGEHFKLRLCSLFRFNDDGLIAEWKDHG